MHGPEAVTESGVYYLVKNKNGRGRKIVRRPRTPYTSPPLPDDFDVITQGCTTTARGGAPTSSWQNYTHPQAPPTPLIPDEFDTGPYSEHDDEGIKGGTARFRETGYFSPESASEQYFGLDPTAVEGSNQNGQYDAYKKDLERMFGGVGVKSTGHANDKRRGGIPKATANELPKAPRKSSEATRVSPDPGIAQDYEVVNNHIVEDGPEKTVTISTWRERVAKEVENETEMSVYYLSATEYVHLESVRVDEESVIESYVDSQADMYPPAPLNGGTMGKMSPSPYSEIYSPSPRRMRDIEPLVRNSSLLKTDVFSGRGNVSKSSSSNSKRTPPNRSFNSSRHSQGKPRTQLPSPPRTSSTPNHAGDSVVGMPRTSTPYISSRSSPRDRASTDFHPTKDGATISSIRPQNQMPTSLELILSSCKPPLTHLTSVLRDLGIITEEHLRAVARLTDETRNREVRDAALKKGVTVMEWAILVDKLLALG